MKKLILIIVILFITGIVGYIFYAKIYTPAKGAYNAAISDVEVKEAKILLNSIRIGQGGQNTQNWDYLMIDFPGTSNPKRTGEKISGSGGKFSFQLAPNGAYAHRIKGDDVLYSVFIDYKTGEYTVTETNASTPLNIAVEEDIQSETPLYNEALNLLQTYAFSQARFFMIHDKYARNFGELDVAPVNYNGYRIRGDADNGNTTIMYGFKIRLSDNPNGWVIGAESLTEGKRSVIVKNAKNSQLMCCHNIDAGACPDLNFELKDCSEFGLFKKARTQSVQPKTSEVNSTTQLPWNETVSLLSLFQEAQKEFYDTYGIYALDLYQLKPELASVWTIGSDFARDFFKIKDGVILDGKGQKVTGNSYNTHGFKITLSDNPNGWIASAETLDQKNKIVIWRGIYSQTCSFDVNAERFAKAGWNLTWLPEECSRYGLTPKH
ncbi:MAG: hypothetical protein LBL61_06535 [Elusimicrobiota bacterium]|jgi:hypothetical protein|nr:hypothetical protein [Elusimicrobiota bacterium]